MALSAEEVSWAYRLLLGREPAADEIEVWRHTATRADLRHAFLTSEEFRLSFAGSPLAAPASDPPMRLRPGRPANPVEWKTGAAQQARLLDHVMQTWTALGRERPHWSVLSSEAFAPDRIAENQAAFDSSGADDVERICAALERCGIAPSGIRHVFEYGCGVGRVTQHLAAAFERVTACDISESHLAIARDVVADIGHDNVEFTLARAPEFGMTTPFDLWFSYIVLQHNPPPVMVLVLRRALSMLPPGGVAIFQVTTYATGYGFSVADYLKRTARTGAIEMHVLPQQVIFRILAEASCQMLEIMEDDAMGPPSAWLSNCFVVRKAADAPAG